MYRLFLFSLIIFAETKWQKPSNGYRKPSKPENTTQKIERIVEKLETADRLVRENYVNKYNITEQYDTEGYILKYKIQHDLEHEVEIKIKNSVIHVNIQLNYGVYYNDVRILPGGVETRDAIWWVDQGDLIITMPYKVRRGIESSLSCIVAEDIEVDVPLSPEFSVYEFFNKHIGH